jgi:hypothetical protein
MEYITIWYSERIQFMNMRRLSLSVLVITGLVLGSMPARVEAKNIKGSVKLGIAAGILLGAHLILDMKESVAEPEQNHKWSDLWSGNWEKTVGAIDEKIVGQREKSAGIKMVPGEKEVKSSAATPATGILGKSHSFVNKVGKSIVDAGKTYAAPALVIGIVTGMFKISLSKGQFTFDHSPLLKWLGDKNYIAMEREDAPAAAAPIVNINLAIDQHGRLVQVPVPAPAAATV